MEAKSETMIESIKLLIKPRTLISFGFYAAFIYLILCEVKIPDALNSIVSILMGYYFGSRNKKGEKNEQKQSNN